MSSQAQDMFWATPPITRTITAAAVLLSFPAWLVGIPDIYTIVFIPGQIFTFRQVPQIWRLVTSFILTGPKFGMVLDPYFLYTYCKSLETEAVRFSGPGDFLVYLIFVAVIIMLLGGIYLGGFMLLSPLTLALAYTYAQENPNRQLSYFIVTFSAKWLPLVMLFMTVITESPYAALVQAMGLVAAHAYEFVTKIWPEYGGGRQLLATPEFAQRWFAKPAGSTTQRGAGTVFNARTPAQNGPQRPAGSGASWRELGPGRRLGGE